jgi:DNA-binding Lrp family transcriptional regulator
MTVAAAVQTKRRPRFRRASEPPAFALTDDDVQIIRHLARHRFLRSTHIAILVGRSPDRTNDRLLRLFHAGYIDRPRAQLDYYWKSGSAPLIYALADRGARLLVELDGASFVNLEWSRKNREAGRPFIEHQIEIADFQVALHRAVRQRGDIQLLYPEDILAAAPAATRESRNPFLLRAKLSHQGWTREIGVVPDFVFGLKFADGSRRCFMVEIDRGTMPVTRSDINQTSFERKMRVYLTAHTARQHQRQFGWKTFRVLTATTDQNRVSSMIETSRRIRNSHGASPPLFLFCTQDELRKGDPLSCLWSTGNGTEARLVLGSAGSHLKSAHR